MPALSRTTASLLRTVAGKPHATTEDHELDGKAPATTKPHLDHGKHALDSSDDDDDNDTSALGRRVEKKATIRVPKRLNTTTNNPRPPAKREAESEDELSRGPFSQSSQPRKPIKTFSKKYGSQNKVARQVENKPASFQVRDSLPAQTKPPEAPKRGFRPARAPEPSSSQPEAPPPVSAPIFRHPAPISNFTTDSTDPSAQSQPITLDSSQLSPPPSSPFTSLPDADPEQIPDDPAPDPNPPCPICGEKIEKDFWDKFQDDICHRRMNLRLQEKFCQAHKARNADDIWNDRGYPKIDWSALQDRLKAHRHHIRAILDNDKARESPYYKQHAKMIKSAKGHTATAAGGRFTGLRAGYYGSKGEKIIAENIVRTFSDKLRELSETDPIIASGGTSGGMSGFVHAILVPEMVVELIMEDMNCERDKARLVLSESVDMGEIFNEEEDEKARRVEVDLLDTSILDDDNDDNSHQSILTEKPRKKFRLA
ncbi:unnamed protein product [Aureobasidium pullulans]|nr:hypothetical protein D6D00_04602 [Aureobasidium pullulans]THZ01822.1 hypothetical protein D6C92_00991 [Aureobasidium pullulans]CAC9886202.1 unnamed protein product [Aureobasidium pullulans]